MFTGGSTGCKTLGFNLVLNFTKFLTGFFKVCLLCHFVLHSRSLSPHVELIYCGFSCFIRVI